MPIGLRLTISIIPTFIMFVGVVMGSPVHWGRGGSVMPHWLGVVFISSTCIYVLKCTWAGVTLADVREFYCNLRHPAQMQSLFDKDKPD